MKNTLLHLCAVIKNPYVSSTLLSVAKVTHKVIHKACVKLRLIFILMCAVISLQFEKCNRSRMMVIMMGC